MGRRRIPVTKDAIIRYLDAVRSAGIEIRSVRVQPDGSVVINGESGEKRFGSIDIESASEPFEEVDHL